MSNREIYSERYTSASLNIGSGDAYSRAMDRVRFELMEQYGTGKDVLDIGCASGAYLAPMVSQMKSAVGLDFVERFLRMFRDRYSGRLPKNLGLVCADARSMPLAGASFDFIYSFSTLYHVPEVERVVAEVARVLRPGGVAALEFGNLWSLNTIVADNWHKQENWAKSFHVSIPGVTAQLRTLGLRIVTIRRFQLLPLYAVPRRCVWLRPLSGRPLRGLLARSMGDVMLDERVSGAPLLRRFAFRHLVIAQAA